jgi:N-formylglutamate amidohydrolase
MSIYNGINQIAKRAKQIMHKMALSQTKVAGLQKANALISKRRKAKKHASSLEDHLIHKIYKIFKIKRTLRSKYSRKCVEMMLD